MLVREVAGDLEVLAPAKLNLFLEILGKRPDGYHELETLMVATNLYDALRFADEPSGRILLECDDPSLPTGRENLVVQAGERLKAASGTERGASITLHKAIPAEAGLAGGSSDAAATLVALDRLWNLKTPRFVLEAMAGELGSDVAFFLRGAAAVCRGRGERIEPLAWNHRLHCVLICPYVGMSTALVYRNLTPPETPRSIGPALEATRRGDVEELGRALFNRLQPVAEAIEPRLLTVKSALERLRPSLVDGHLMSGSGSAYFGLCRDEFAAGHAASLLQSLGLGRVRVVTCGP